MKMNFLHEHLFLLPWLSVIHCKLSSSNTFRSLIKKIQHWNSSLQSRILKYCFKTEIMHDYFHHTQEKFLKTTKQSPWGEHAWKYSKNVKTTTKQKLSTGKCLCISSNVHFVGKDGSENQGICMAGFIFRAFSLFIILSKERNYHER